MTKKILLTFVILFLFLIGCGNQTVYVCSDGSEVTAAADCVSSQIIETSPQETAQTNLSQIITEEKTSEKIPDSSSSLAVIDYTLSDSEEALLKSRFPASKRAELSTPLVKNLHVGDVYVAALGLRNILGGATQTFTVTIKFREAKDFSGSIIPTDDVLVQDWLGKNIYTEYTLERGDEIVLPIIITVGDTLTASGDPTVPGTYIYDVYIAYETNPEMTDQYQNLLLTVQVGQ